MDNIKISASFKLKGGAFYQEKDNEGNPLYYDMNTIDLYNKKKNLVETVEYKTSKCKPYTQSINMSMEAYQYMMDSPTAGISPNHWRRMSENQRISEHLKGIQHDLHAISFEFAVFND